MQRATWKQSLMQLKKLKRKSLSRIGGMQNIVRDVVTLLSPSRTCRVLRNFLVSHRGELGPVYTRSDPNGSVPKV